jgi:hypothetical protein
MQGAGGGDGASAWLRGPIHRVKYGNNSSATAEGLATAVASPKSQGRVPPPSVPHPDLMASSHRSSSAVGWGVVDPATAHGRGSALAAAAPPPPPPTVIASPAIRRGPETTSGADRSRAIGLGAPSRASHEARIRGAGGARGAGFGDGGADVGLSGVAQLPKSVFGTLQDAFGSYAQPAGRETQQVAEVQRRLASPSLAPARHQLREVFGRYASPTRTSSAVQALRAAFNHPDFDLQRRTLRAAFSDLLPQDSGGGHSSDDHTFSALLSSSKEAQELIRCVRIVSLAPQSFHPLTLPHPQSRRQNTLH